MYCVNYKVVLIILPTTVMVKLEYVIWGGVIHFKPSIRELNIGAARIPNMEGTWEIVIGTVDSFLVFSLFTCVQYRHSRYMERDGKYKILNILVGCMKCLARGPSLNFFFFQSSTLYKIGSRKDDFNFGLSFLEKGYISYEKNCACFLPGKGFTWCGSTSNTRFMSPTNRAWQFQ